MAYQDRIGDVQLFEYLRERFQRLHMQVAVCARFA